jgi:chemotaxis family two-component system response regulator Rcp1
VPHGCLHWFVAEQPPHEPRWEIPVVVLTTSTAEQDILHSYDLHANCFITKPVDVAQFIEVIRNIEGFWLEVVRLPG